MLEVIVGLKTTTTSKAKTCYEQLCDHLNKPLKQDTVTTTIKNMPQISESWAKEFKAQLKPSNLTNNNLGRLPSSLPKNIKAHPISKL